MDKFMLFLFVCILLLWSIKLLVTSWYYLTQKQYKKLSLTIFAISVIVLSVYSFFTPLLLSTKYKIGFSKEPLILQNSKTIFLSLEVPRDYNIKSIKLDDYGKDYLIIRKQFGLYRIQGINEGTTYIKYLISDDGLYSLVIPVCVDPEYKSLRNLPGLTEEVN